MQLDPARKPRSIRGRKAMIELRIIAQGTVWSWQSPALLITQHFALHRLWVLMGTNHRRYRSTPQRVMMIPRWMVSHIRNGFDVSIPTGWSSWKPAVQWANWLESLDVPWGDWIHPNTIPDDCRRLLQTARDIESARVGVVSPEQITAWANGIGGL